METINDLMLGQRVVETHGRAGVLVKFEDDNSTGAVRLDIPAPPPGYSDGLFRFSLAALKLETPVPRCVYPSCPNSRRTRGLCHGHYQTMRSYVRLGRSNEADLVKRGLLLPAGTGGGSVEDHSAFLAGSTVKGKGAA